MVVDLQTPGCVALRSREVLALTSRELLALRSRELEVLPVSLRGCKEANQDP
jgi:hypothetical protein